MSDCMTLWFLQRKQLWINAFLPFNVSDTLNWDQRRKFDKYNYSKRDGQHRYRSNKDKLRCL